MPPRGCAGRSVVDEQVTCRQPDGGEQGEGEAAAHTRTGRSRSHLVEVHDRARRSLVRAVERRETAGALAAEHPRDALLLVREQRRPQRGRLRRRVEGQACERLELLGVQRVELLLRLHLVDHRNGRRGHRHGRRLLPRRLLRARRYRHRRACRCRRRRKRWRRREKSAASEHGDDPVALLRRREHLDVHIDVPVRAIWRLQCGLEATETRGLVHDDVQRGCRRRLHVTHLSARHVEHPNGVPVVCIVRLALKRHKLARVHLARVVLDADDLCDDLSYDGLMPVAI